MVTILAFPGSELLLEIDKGRLGGESVVKVLITCTASCREGGCSPLPSALQFREGLYLGEQKKTHSKQNDKHIPP